MAQQTINIGSGANKGDGDPLRTAFDKINDNFTELYGKVIVLEGGGVAIQRDTQGSIFGDDSTLLVDAVNSLIPSSVLSGNLPALDGSALTNLTIPAQTFASLTGTPTTIAGYGISDAYTKAEVDNAITSSVLPSGSSQSIDVVAADSTVLVDSVNGTLNATTLTGALPAIDGSALTGVTTAFSDITSTPTTLAGYGITDAPSTSAETTFTADVKFDTGVEEKFFLITGSASVIAMDCDNGHIHYLTGLANDITANFANLDLTVSYATNVTVIINQGATPYEITAVEIGGAAQTIEWQGNSAPTGTANGIDSFSFTILNHSGTYVVLGQMVAFGGV